MENGLKSAVGTAHWNARMAPGFRFFETNYIFLPANPNSVPFYTHHPLITIIFPLQRWIFSVLCLFFPNQQERIQYSNVLPINSYNFVYSLSPVSIIPPFLFLLFWVFLSYSSPINQVFSSTKRFNLCLQLFHSIPISQFGKSSVTHLKLISASPNKVSFLLSPITRIIKL